ncbi:hypothetical protein HS048_36000 [Planomonospora sp. ID91781]|uniref:hypothetical protein n=1 Tax=Planomonospora sp. ID91781 TaxID=2738135 RepID=UPI0018C380BB|nr:hypothetical protein [Planomonospora sp. ID91781]MBG0826073.1 hypothetical protein [Planomonospora sp. ID91781]
MRRHQRVSQSYNLKRSTVNLVEVAAARDGVSGSAYVEKALWFYALSRGLTGTGSFEEQARNDEAEFISVEGASRESSSMRTKERE